MQNPDMKRGWILTAFGGVIMAALLYVMPGAWNEASRQARKDVSDLIALLAQRELIGVRIAEQEALEQAAFWGGAGEVLYPLPDAFSPLKGELGPSDLAEIGAFRAGLDHAGWTSFGLDARRILYCQSKPAACLVYDRSALAAQIGIASLGARPAFPLWKVALALLAMAACLGAAVLFRRKRSPKTPRFEFLPDQFRALCDGREIRLSKRDTKILALLMARGGAVVTRDELYDEGWGRDYMPNSRALDQHIINLRRKLDPDRDRPEMIETVRGIGYRILQ